MVNRQFETLTEKIDFISFRQQLLFDNDEASRILFENEVQAESALAVTESMIKLLYVPKELPWAAEATQISSLSKRFFRFLHH